MTDTISKIQVICCSKCPCDSTSIKIYVPTFKSKKALEKTLSILLRRYPPEIIPEILHILIPEVFPKQLHNSISNDFPELFYIILPKVLDTSC